MVKGTSFELSVVFEVYIIIKMTWKIVTILVDIVVIKLIKKFISICWHRLDENLCNYNGGSWKTNKDCEKENRENGSLHIHLNPSWSEVNVTKIKEIMMITR